MQRRSSVCQPVCPAVTRSTYMRTRIQLAWICLLACLLVFDLFYILQLAITTILYCIYTYIVRSTSASFIGINSCSIEWKRLNASLSRHSFLPCFLTSFPYLRAFFSLHGGHIYVSIVQYSHIAIYIVIRTRICSPISQLHVAPGEKDGCMWYIIVQQT